MKLPMVTIQFDETDGRDNAHYFVQFDPANGENPTMLRAFKHHPISDPVNLDSMMHFAHAEAKRRGVQLVALHELCEELIEDYSPPSSQRSLSIRGGAAAGQLGVCGL